MTADLRDLDTLPVRRLFWRYAAPSIAGMLVTGVYYLVDGMFVGRYVGETGLAAINLAYPLVMLILGVGAMLSMGAATRVSLSQGAGKPDEARNALAAGLWLTLLAGLLIPLAGWLWREPLLSLLRLDASPALRQQAGLYLSLMLGGAVLVLGQLMTAALLRNDGRPRLATALLSAGAVLNILLDYLLVVVWPFGLAGAAAATLLAEGLVSAAGLIYLASRHARLRLSASDLLRWPRGMADVLKLGLSGLMMELNLALLLIVHNLQLLRYGDETQVAAYAIAGYTESLFILVVHGLAIGVQPLISHATGAGEPRRVAETLRYAIRATLLTGGLSWLLVQALPELIATVYTSDNPALLAAGVAALRLHLLAMPLDGLIIMGVVLLQAMADTRGALFGTVGKTLLLLPVLWLLPQALGLNGVWLALPLVNLLLGAVMALMLARQLRRLGGDRRRRPALT